MKLWPITLAAALMFAQTPAVKGVFDIKNEQFDFLRPSNTRITSVSARAEHVKPIMGAADAITISFFPRAMTAADSADPKAIQLKKGDYAELLLLLDKDRKIRQVNLSYVVPGTSVVRTVAAKASELARWNANFHLDGDKLRLKTKDVFSETNDQKKTLRLTWDVDVNLFLRGASR